MRALIAALLLLAPLPALAASGSGDCGQCGCSISVSALNFGEYNPLSAAATDSTATLAVRCTYTGTGEAPKLRLEIGLSSGNGGSTAARRMRAGTATMTYNLYRDSARQSVWGEVGSSGEVTVNYDKTDWSNGIALPIYGRIPARQTVTPGTYSDLVTVTVSY